MHQGLSEAAYNPEKHITTMVPGTLADSWHVGSAHVWTKGSVCSTAVWVLRHSKYAASKFGVQTCGTGRGVQQGGGSAAPNILQACLACLEETWGTHIKFAARCSRHQAQGQTHTPKHQIHRAGIVAAMHTISVYDLCKECWSAAHDQRAPHISRKRAGGQAHQDLVTIATQRVRLDSVSLSASLIDH